MADLRANLQKIRVSKKGPRETSSVLGSSAASITFDRRPSHRIDRKGNSIMPTKSLRPVTLPEVSENNGAKSMDRNTRLSQEHQGHLPKIGQIIVTDSSQNFFDLNQQKHSIQPHTNIHLQESMRMPVKSVPMSKCEPRTKKRDFAAGQKTDNLNSSTEELDRTQFADPEGKLLGSSTNAFTSLQAATKSR